MRIKFFVKSIFYVVLGNGLQLVSGIILGLVLPLFFSIENFGYFRMFTLYVTYSSLFQLGFINGIYLKFGGKKYEDLDKFSFIKYSNFLVKFQTIVSIIVIIFALLLFKDERKIIIIFFGMNLFSFNLTMYFQYISQITMRFKEYSFRNIIYSILMIIGVLILYFLKIDHYIIILAYIVIVNFILMLWYMITYRSILIKTGNKDVSVKTEYVKIKDLFKLGIPFLIANFSTLFLLNLSKQFVDIYFSISDFAIYSFAFSLLSMVNIFVTSTSVIMYPLLKQVDQTNMRKNYNVSINIVISLVLFAMMLFFPLHIFITYYLPKYLDSMLIILIIFPSLLLTSTNQIIRYNYLKVLQKTRIYLYNSLFTIVISVVSHFVVFYYFNTLVFMAIAYTSTLVIWYLISDLYFIKEYKVKTLKSNLFLFIGMLLFYYLGIYHNSILGMVVYFLLIITITLVFNISYITIYIKRLGSRQVK